VRWFKAIPPLTGCCFYAVLDFFFSFLLKHKDVITKGNETKNSTAQKNISWDHFDKWCPKFLFLYLGNTGV